MKTYEVVSRFIVYADDLSQAQLKAASALEFYRQGQPSVRALAREAEVQIKELDA